MLPAERRARLADLVNSSGVISTESLASTLGVSTETIRRDLTTLEDQGLIARVHGGATKRNSSIVSTEPSFDVRSTESLDAKQRIGRTAAAMIPSGGFVMIDVGSTALYVARALPASFAATIVTTSLRVASELAERPGVEVLIPGGSLRAGELALSGVGTMQWLDGKHFDLALLGSGGLHAEAGLSDYYLEEAEIRRSVITHSAASFVLSDSTKFDKIARHRVAEFGDFDGLIADQAPTGELLTAVKRSRTELVIAE